MSKPSIIELDFRPARQPAQRLWMRFSHLAFGSILAAAGLVAPQFTDQALANEEEAVERSYVTAPNAPAFQTWVQADEKSKGCVSCHTDSDRKTMHASSAVVLGCTDCHGGNAGI